MKKNHFSIFVLLFATSLLTGCKSALALAKTLGDHSQMVNASTAETQRPVENRSVYTDSLYGLRELLKAIKATPICIAVEPISDQSASGGKLPTQVSMMVETTVNKLSGNNVHHIPYTDRSLNTPRNSPILTIHGAITEYDTDQETISTGGGVGGFMEMGSTEGDFSAERDSGMSISSLSIDFSLSDKEKHIYVPGLHVSNNMRLIKITTGDGFGFAIQGTGLNFNETLTFKVAEHKALRLLIELSILELIGRYYKVPYWVCLIDPDNVEDTIVDNMIFSFKGAQKVEKGRKLQELLNYVKNNKLVVDGIIGPNTKKMIKEYADARGVDYTNYEAVYRQLLIDGASKMRQTYEMDM